ncbi:hypothetical protein [Nocardiopsis dassonvillei]|uniref:hypothetical protein n=1 Tax=Nocardiopsis dassonvillei TaxID=2014 RepID=UPI00157BC77A|nr:hypothetical protein [Nocardiopsis dassonvillei]
MDPSHATSTVEDDPIQDDLKRISQASPQCSFIDSRPQAPEATSTLYIRQFSTTAAKDGSRDHTVTGVHIVLAKGHQNQLWEAFHVDRSTQTIDPKNPKVAVGSLRIYCDTLEVHGAFSLPEANVDIFARRLIWADEKASIDTSPLAWSVGKAQDGMRGSPTRHGARGVRGRDAGSIRVFVHKVDSSSTSNARFIARGGCGQAPGSGDHVETRDSVKLKYLWSGDEWRFVDDGYLPASSYIVEYYKNGENVHTDWDWWGGGMWGGLKPGIPGDGGNGGTLTSNQGSEVLVFSNTGGAGGARERPVAFASYTFTVTESSLQIEETDPDPSLGPAVGKTGGTPKLISYEKPHAWVHPLGLQATLDYVRDLSLAGAQEQLRDMLPDYREALSQPRPDTGAWDGVESEWEAAHTEIATLLLRDAAHLDYFGNPAGYSPLLSLSGSIQLYRDEAKRALRMMLISKRITTAERSAREASTILGTTIETVNADTKAAADQVTEGGQEIHRLTHSIDTVSKELSGLATELTRLRDKLLAQAQADAERKARIRSFLKIAGALLQVIPVGQPVLGALGSLTAVGSDFAGDDWESAPATISKIGPVLTQSGKALNEARKATEAKDKENKTPRDWSKIGESLGSACSLTSEGLKALQVPRTEVEAALAKLQAESREWKDLSEKIRKVNEKKAALFADLQAVMQSVGEGYSRLAANAGTVVRLKKERNQQMASLDPEAVAAVQDMGRRSRRTLQEYLYLVVKSYEAAVLKQLNVDWQLPDVTDKVDSLVGPAEEWDAAKLNAHAEALDTVFQNTLADIRKHLLKNYVKTAVSEKPLTLLATQSPRQFEALNSKTRRVVIDPLAVTLIEPGKQLARLRNVTLEHIALDRKWSDLPADFYVRLELVPARKGIMRRGSGLYAITSEAPTRWGWTCSPRQEGGAARIKADTTSPDNDDILDIILGQGSKEIRQKLSLVPAWSDLTLSVDFPSDLRASQRPKVTELRFTVEIDSGAAPEDQKVLTVRPEGGVGDEVITCSAPDKAGRGDGNGLMVRIYDQDTTVGLQAPAGSGNTVFQGWETTEEEGEPGATSVQIELTNHVTAWPCWGPAPEGLAQVPAQARPGPTETRQVIRMQPDAASAAIGLVPRWGEATVLEHGQGWDLVNYRGITGWITAT